MTRNHSFSISIFLFTAIVFTTLIPCRPTFAADLRGRRLRFATLYKESETYGKPTGDVKELIKGAVSRFNDKVDSAWLAANASLVKEFFEGSYAYPTDHGDTVYFPGEERASNSTGYHNAVRPPRPVYAKIPKGSPIAIKVDGQGHALAVRHIGLQGAYSPDQLTGIGISPVSLLAQAKDETVRFSKKWNAFVFRTSRVKGLGTSGRKATQIVQKQDNGDLLVVEYVVGWAPLPSFTPMRHVTKYRLTKK